MTKIPDPDWVRFLKDLERPEYYRLREESRALDARREQVTARLGVLRGRCAKRREKEAKCPDKKAAGSRRYRLARGSEQKGKTKNDG